MSDQPPPELAASTTPIPADPVEVEDRADKVEQHAQELALKPRTLKDLMRSDEFRKAVAEVAPAVMRPSRFVRAALTAMMRVPLLAEATRESFFLAMLNCAFYGLEPDGRRAHLIPFRNKKVSPPVVECQLIIDYKGLAELVRRSGEVTAIHADAVYQGDHFDFSYGTNSHLIHAPGMMRDGKPKQFYSYVRLKDSSESFEVMTLSEVEKVRRRSKSPDDGPWVTDFNEMGKKTVFRRHAKWLPLTPEARFSLDRSDPDAIDAPNTAGIEESDEKPPQRLSARDRILRSKQAAAAAEPPPPAAGDRSPT